MASSRNSRVSPSPRPGSSGTVLSREDELEMDKITNEDPSPRPVSSASRQAWNDNEGFDMASEEPDNYDEQDGSSDEDEDGDHAPTAMESEVYMGTDMKAMDLKTARAKEDHARAGLCRKIMRGIRSLWRTRQTDDTAQDKELHVRTTLRELIIYIVFLIVLCIMTFGMTNSTMYYYTKVMSELFLDSQFPDTKNTFRGMTTSLDFWRFAETPLMDGLYWETWYNNDNVTEDELGFIFYENKMLGVPRLRQVKVTNESCIVHTDFRDNIKQCYAFYSESLEDTSPYGLRNGTAWEYTTEEVLDGSSHWGEIATYGGGGYYMDLGKRKQDSLKQILELKENLWIDRGTRAIFVDFTVYNANINLFCIVRLVVEFPPTGGAIPTSTFRTVKLLRYVTAMDYFIMACEGIFVLFILYYSVEEFLEIKRHKFSYFKSTWNCLDVIIIAVSVVCMFFHVYRTFTVDKMIERLLSEPDMYADFEYLGRWQSIFTNVTAVAVFLAWIKVFKYISFNKTMTQLSSTLSRCAKDVGGFTIMFLIIFFAYAQLGYLIFGTQIKDFRSIMYCVYTLFRIVLGDFDFHELESANRVLGPIFFITYVFVVFFVLLNMFLAIINDTYSEVKADIANQKSEFEISDYFKKGYDKMVGKLNFKRDKIADIQEALAHADANADQHLDFDEWRHELKCRGHADAEIEAVFAKYDVDGDRILDAEEQMKMAADLEGQKTELNNQLAELEEAQITTGNQPSTARSKSRVSFNDSIESDYDDDEGGKGGGRRGGAAVSYEEFVVLSRRVDRMEHSIGSIVSKIDAVLVKLEAMERAKAQRRETMNKLLDSITEEREIKEVYKSEMNRDSLPQMSRASTSASGYSDDDEDDGEQKRKSKMENLVREEFERWGSDASLRGGRTSATSPRAGSAVRSRPTTSQSRLGDIREVSEPGTPGTKRGLSRSASQQSVQSIQSNKSGRKSSVSQVAFKLNEETEDDDPLVELEKTLSRAGSRTSMINAPDHPEASSSASRAASRAKSSASRSSSVTSRRHSLGAVAAASGVTSPSSRTSRASSSEDTPVASTPPASPSRASAFSPRSDSAISGRTTVAESRASTVISRASTVASRASIEDDDNIDTSNV